MQVLWEVMGSIYTLEGLIDGVYTVPCVCRVCMSYIYVCVCVLFCGVYIWMYFVYRIIYCTYIYIYFLYTMLFWHLKKNFLAGRDCPSPANQFLDISRTQPTAGLTSSFWLEYPWRWFFSALVIPRPGG